MKVNDSQEMNSYDYFCDFAWERLEDVCGLIQSEGIPSFSPFIEFVEGCAFICLYDLSANDQEESFGFTLKDVADDTFMGRFIEENLRLVSRRKYRQ